jgi:signal peptidase I
MSQKSHATSNKTLLIAVGVAAVLSVILYFAANQISSHLFSITPREIVGKAMSPNYNSGMLVLTKNLPNNSVILNRGDVVVFKYPENKSVDFIKRIIGLPGETVAIKSGEVYINDKKLDESAYKAADIQTLGGAFFQEGETKTIPTNQYLMLGDNRPYSSDSRVWGFVPQEDIEGVVFYCYWNCPAK